MYVVYVYISPRAHATLMLRALLLVVLCRGLLLPHGKVCLSVIGRGGDWREGRRNERRKEGRRRNKASRERDVL